MNDSLPFYLVLAMRTPDFQPEAGVAHQAFLQDLIEQGLLELTGPFTDGSGGAYILRTTDIETATKIAHNDPLHITGSSTLTVHEWRAHRPRAGE
ncbi:YciI family protein [Luteibacter yeojuensis]|uniref:YCII-related domain-containing protein n=1 Tax=Luteibacter yeojuensis TaxID=345309 RepID=A0A7X5QU09_9GAMM|nr:YciI family protein [Luteibacter yeojuensis]NID15285.1 hypothetical protein [Luteibacter yeojuensis]